MRKVFILFIFLLLLLCVSPHKPAYAARNLSVTNQQNFVSLIENGFGNFFRHIGNFFGYIPTENTASDTVSETDTVQISKTYLANMFTLMDKKIKSVEKIPTQPMLLNTTLTPEQTAYTPIGASILPTTTTYDLGSVTTPWSDVYVQNLYLPGNGSVGIGTTNPVAALDVNGNIALQANGSIDVRSAGAITIGGTSQTGLTLGRSGAQTTINGSSVIFGPTSWTATPTISGTITANGGLSVATNQSFTLSGFGTTANSMLYADASGVVSQVGTGTSGYCLVSGTSVPFWQTCPTGSSLWKLASGALYPTDTSNDLLLGGTSTASATFGFINLGNGTPTATIDGNFILKVPSGNNQNIQMGVLNGGALKFQTSVGGDSVLSTRLYIGANGQVGINTTSPTTNFDINGNASASSSLSFNANATNDSLNFLNGSNLKIQTSPGGSGLSTRLYVDNGGNIGIGTTSPASLLSVGTGSPFQITNAGAIGAASGITASGGITFSSLNTDGGLLVTNTSGVLSQTTTGSLGSCLISNGGGAPSWGGCGGTNYLSLNSGFLSPASGGTAISIGQTIGMASSGLSVKVNALGNAAAYIENSGGSGDILTASSAGSTKFRLTSSGSPLFQGDMLTSIGSGASANGSNAVINNIDDQGSLIPNAGFESIISSSIADGWYPAATTSAGVFTHDSTNVIQGTASLKINQTANEVDAIYSSCIPLTGDSHAAYALNWFDFGASGTVPTIGGWIDWYTSKANCQSDAAATISSPAQVNQQGSTGSWQRHGSGTTAISTANGKTWGRVHFEFSCPSQPCVSNIDGIRLIEKDGGQGLDYAENYPADPHNVPHAGDVVSLASAQATAEVAPATKFMDQAVIGVVSTNPGYVLDDGSVPDPKVPIALSGRVPVRVSTQNGSIQIGDYVTSSTVPGVAVKATEGGTVIGKALEAYTNPDPTKVSEIEVFLDVSYADPTPQILFTNSGDLSVNGQAVNNVPSDIQSKTIQSQNTVVTEATETNSFADLQTEVASISGKLSEIDDLSQKISSIEKSIPISPANQDTMVTSDSATISGKLSVSGETLLSSVGITGKVTMGLLTIDGLDTTTSTPAATLNTISGPLKLQSFGLNGLDILNGKISIDTNGNMISSANISAKTIFADKLHLKDTGMDAVVGTAVILAGEKSIVVTTNALTDNAHIFVSPDTVPVPVSKKRITDTTFEIDIPTSLSQNLKVDWWIVN